MVTEAIANACNFDPKEITGQTSLLELGLDSLSLTALVAQIEAVYECVLTPDEVLELFGAMRVSDVIAFVDTIAARPA